MAANNAQSPAAEGSVDPRVNLQRAADQIDGLLSEDDEGVLNVTDGRPSRASEDYDETKPHDEQPKRDQRGRFQKKAAAPEDEETDIQAEDEQLAAGDAEDEDTDESEDGDTDEQLADSADEETETDEQETDDEGEPIQTLAQFAEALEVPIEQLLESITDTFNAAGEETTVTLAELRAGYQKDADYRRQTQQLAERTRQAEQDYQTRMQQFEDSNRFLASHLQATEQLLQSQLDDPNLTALRSSDPAEWSARREEIGQQIAQVQQARQQAMQQYQMFQQQQLTDLKTREMQALQEAVPDFKPDVHGEKAKQTMRSLGYTDNEIAKIFDHRLVKAAIEMADLRAEVEALRSEKTKASDAVKRVKKDVPKLQKPGKQKPRAPLKRNNLARLRKRAAQSGSVDDAAAVINEMGII